LLSCLSKHLTLTLHPVTRVSISEPAVEGYTTPGGYSYKAVKPIALAKVRPPRPRCLAHLLVAHPNFNEAQPWSQPPCALEHQP
jgi:glycine cleavage system aminomethyltransferase T